MPKFNSAIALLLAVLLTACGSTPGPVIEPEAADTASTTATTGADTQLSATDETTDDGAEAAPVDPAQLAYQAAVEALRNGDAEAALSELQRLSETVPTMPRLYTNLGLAHFRLEQFDAAELAFREAVLRDDDDAVAHNHIGILERRKGQFQQALQAYQRAIEIDVKYARAHLNLGILFDLYLQDLEKALAQYRVYQTLTNEQDKQVAGWIVDIERRLKSDS